MPCQTLLPVDAQLENLPSQCNLVYAWNASFEDDYEITNGTMSWGKFSLFCHRGMRNSQLPMQTSVVEIWCLSDDSSLLVS